MELAERKFLRQVATYSDDSDSFPYPRLFMLDLLTDDEIAELATAYFEEIQKKREDERRKEEEERKALEEDGKREYIRQELKAQKEREEELKERGEDISSIVIKKDDVNGGAECKRNDADKLEPGVTIKVDCDCDGVSLYKYRFL